MSPQLTTTTSSRSYSRALGQWCSLPPALAGSARRISPYRVPVREPRGGPWSSIVSWFGSTRSTVRESLKRWMRERPSVCSRQLWTQHLRHEAASDELRPNCRASDGNRDGLEPYIQKLRPDSRPVGTKSPPTLSLVLERHRCQLEDFNGEIASTFAQVGVTIGQALGGGKAFGFDN